MRLVSHQRAQGVIHADLKPLNVVRVKQKQQGSAGPSSGGDDKWLLIDLDAAAAIGAGYVGLKSSTAVSDPS